MIENYFMMNIGNHIDVAHIVLRVLVALMIGAAIGEERESKNRPAGLRTHVLVSLAAATIAILECEIICCVSELSSSTINVSAGRLSVGVVSGIGFLGAGTIMMLKNKITGLTTAASLWCTAALGLAAGMGYFSLAILGTMLAIAILEGMAKLVRKFRVNEIRITHLESTAYTEAFTAYCAKYDVTIITESLRYNKNDDKIVIVQSLLVKMPAALPLQQVCSAVMAMEGVSEIETD